MRFDDIPVAQKLMGSTLLVVLVLLCASFLTLRVQNTALMDAMTEVERAEDIIMVSVKWRGMTETNVQRLVASALIADPQASQEMTDQVKTTIAAISALQAQLAEKASSPQAKAAFEKVIETRKPVLEAVKKTDELKAAGDLAAIRAHINGTVNATVKTYLAAMDDFIDVQRQQRDQAKREADTTRVNARTYGLVAALLVALLSLAGMGWISRGIRRTLTQAIDASRAIASGDLTHDIRDDRRDEFGQLMSAMGEMTHKLRGLVGEVRSGVESVSTASSQIASGNQDLSSRTEQAAANLEQTASSMEELTGTVTQSAETARKANLLATAAQEAATRGGQVVTQVVGSMQDITTSSKKIADIIGVIDGIAFQTNILALNAAVEAARAGEQGRGFAVVASEVRSLAQRSAGAAKEIKALIGSSVDSVESGSRLVAQTGEAMEQIVTSVKRMTEMMAEISTATHEQRDGISQVNQSVTNLDQMTQQNAALVEESAAAASSLREQAQRLAEVVSVFNVGNSHAS